jgi:molecular chaperone DnaJ
MPTADSPLPDHYRLLGVAPRATDVQIKAAYRKLSRVYHPDAQGGSSLAEDCFKQIAGAYAELADANRRLNYDRMLMLRDPLRLVDDPRAERALDVLDTVVTRLRKRQASLPNPHQGRDLRVEHPLPFARAMLGGLTIVRAEFAIACNACHGAGTTEPQRNPVCHVCQGNGMLKTGLRRQDVRCGFCSGRGLLLLAPCQTCAGAGQVATQQEVQLHVPARCRDGAHLRVRGGGEAVAGGKPGDLIAIVRIQPDPFLRVDGDDLTCQVPLTWSEAVAGARVPIATLEGVQWLTVPPNTPPGREFRIVGHGLPLGANAGGTAKRGALRVQVYIDMPTELTASQAAAVIGLEAQLGAHHFARAMTYRAAVETFALEDAG